MQQAIAQIGSMSCRGMGGKFSEPIRPVFGKARETDLLQAMFCLLYDIYKNDKQAIKMSTVHDQAHSGRATHIAPKL